MSINLAPNAGLSHRLRANGARSLQQTQRSLERLSTGKRINRPSDDPAGFIAAEQIRGELIDIKSELKTYDQQRLSLAQRGSQLSTIQSGLIDLQGRIVEASAGVISDIERTDLQQQVDAALEAFNLVAGETSTELLPLESGGLASFDRGDTGLAAELVELESQSMLRQQVTVGAEQRQQEVFEQLASDREVILTETLSQIEDADFAVEASNLATSQALTTAANTAQVYSQQSHSDLIGGLLDEVDVDDAVAATRSE